MKKGLLVINGLLLTFIAGALFQLYSGWTAFRIARAPDTIQYEGGPFGVPLVPLVQEAGANSDWTRISDQNLFSFDRNDVAIAAAARPAVVRPQPTLFGTVSLGDGPVALLAAEGGNNRNSRPYRIGETVDGWTIVGIEAKSVVVESAGVQATILMNDPTAAVPRVTRKTSAAGRPQVQVSNVATAPVASPQVQSSVNRPTTRPPAPNPSAVTEDDVPPGFRIQRTPFGNRVIPIPEP